jgi:uncharacterized protein YbaP (TraB family)
MAMSSITVSSETKAEFDSLKDGETHDEMMQKLIETYKSTDTELVLDEVVNRVIDEIDDTVATKAELAAYRGTKDAIESTVIKE